MFLKKKKTKRLPKRLTNPWKMVTFIYNYNGNLYKIELPSFRNCCSIGNLDKFYEDLKKEEINETILEVGQQ